MATSAIPQNQTAPLPRPDDDLSNILDNQAVHLAILEDCSLAAIEVKMERTARVSPASVDMMSANLEATFIIGYVGTVVITLTGRDYIVVAALTAESIQRGATNSMWR